MLMLVIVWFLFDLVGSFMVMHVGARFNVLSLASFDPFVDDFD